MSETMPGMGMWPMGPLMMLVMAALVILPFWFIFSKAGYSKWLSLLMVVPIINVILLYFLAFTKWPSIGNRNL
ncbi:hypothetical protein [Rheinheimera salexigens]|uniref:Uncharacterized protein n=1 Tax=Rheinheimera salexigens TaxID=1628148 RepID=A0A1E7Q2Z6_9GAMM|nr:hypothetical protein [Rheinheimera salexigens]OEY68501.1 hypothetical protein BI198_02145 [Rheinheimera salexigens]